MDRASDKGRSVLKQFELLRSIRQPLDTSYRDCYSYINPSLGVGFDELHLDGVSAATSAGNKTAQRLDTTGTEAVRLLSSSTLSSLTPPNTRWFDLEPPIGTDELDQDGKQWLEEAAARVHTLIHGSNYDSEALEFVMHLMIAGMAGLYIELKDSKLHFDTWPLNHLYCQETLNRGYIDTVYRSFEFTVQEAAIEFGLDALPQKMQDLHRSNEHDPRKHRFVVTIRPRLRDGKQTTGSTKRNLPWESLWVSDCGTIVRESGFHEMPVIVPRWLKIPDTDYARGPVFDALPDLKTLNKVKENMLLNMEMHITGMFKVKDDGVINPNNVKFGARRVIPVGDMDNLQPLQSGGDIQFAMNEIASLQTSIRKMLLADQLGPTEKAIQTATEVQTRNNQVRQVLGPIFARLQAEFLTPFVDRCFGLVARAGMLPPVPESIAAGNGLFEIGYRSPLARSQKLQELDAIDQMQVRLGQLAQAKPELLDYINYDNLVTKYGDLLGVDPNLLLDQNEVKRLRLAREREQQALLAQQQAAALASSRLMPSAP